MTPISAERVEEIVSALNAAGLGWREVAESIPEIDEVTTDSPTWHDNVTLTEVVEQHPGLLVETRIYWAPYEGRWRSTGWSAAGQGLYARARPWRWDADAGAFVDSSSGAAHPTCRTKSWVS